LGHPTYEVGSTPDPCCVLHSFNAHDIRWKSCRKTPSS